MEEVDRRFDPALRGRLAGALHATRAAGDAIDAIASGDAVVVTTGQQAGLFGGPLYTIYKILSAIRLAAALEPVIGRRVLPLFWVASDDHDWAEVDHAHVLDPANQLVRLDLAAQDSAPIPVGERMLGAGAGAAVDALAAALPQTDLAAKTVERIRSIYRPDNTMSAAFRELLEGWFEEFGLLLVDPRHPAMKELAAPVLRRELENAADHEARLATQTQRLAAAGYHPQVSVLKDEANVFLETPAGRERLVRQGERWRTKLSGTELSRDELMQLLSASPARFSPNVFLRPVVESHTLPTLAYVGGPAEVAYFAQLGCLFDAHDVGMPLVFPRFSVGLVETKVRKVLDRFGLQPEDMRQPVQELASRVVRDEFPEPVRDALSTLRRAWGEGFGKLEAGAKGIDPTLQAPLQHMRNSGFQQLDDAEKKIAAALKRRGAVLIEQLEKAHANLFPNGQPQERVLNATQYIARYGAELLPEIAARMDVELAREAPGWTGVSCG